MQNLHRLPSSGLLASLRRVLEEGTFLRRGGTKPIKVDVRLVTAMITNLRGAVEQAHFREDLFYRLNVVAAFDPPIAGKKGRHSAAGARHGREIQR